MTRARHSLALALLLGACSPAPRAANEVCVIDGGARANVPLSLEVAFDMSGCAAPDARCVATVDAGTIHLATSATLCSTGTNPGGSTPTAACALPPLSPGAYTLAPFDRTLLVLADGGATRCGQRSF